MFEIKAKQENQCSGELILDDRYPIDNYDGSLDLIIFKRFPSVGAHDTDKCLCHEH